VENFIPPGERKERVVSVQLLQAEVVSPLGVPLAPLTAIVAVIGMFAALAVLGSLSVPRRWGWLRGAAGMGLVAAGWLLITFLTVPSERLVPLSVVCLGLLGGCALWGWMQERSTPPQPEQSARTAWCYPALAAVVVLGGACLRLYGIQFGLPDNFHPDEVPKVNAIMRMREQNTLNPHYFLHPSLLLYSTYAMNTVLHLLGVTGEFRDTAFLAGRLVSATAGILSLVLTYQIGRRLFSPAVGVSAAALLAVTPLHVTCSRYLKEDALLTCVVLACVLTTVVAVQSGRRWMVLLAGLLAGVTAGAKYSGILMAILPASAPWLVSRSWWPDRRWVLVSLLVLLVAPLGFLLTTPFAVLDFAKFSKDFLTESHHMQNGHTNTIDAWSQLWMYHFWRSIMPGMTQVVAVAAVVGVGALLRRWRTEGLLVIGVLLLFYLPSEYVKAKPAPQPERYIMPCLPFLAIALAELLSLLSRGATRRVAFAALTGAFAALPLVRTVELAREVPFDTRHQMRDWMRQHLPAGAKVLMDWKPYSPRFEEGEFDVEYIPRARILIELDVGDLKRSGADYLVLSSFFYDRYFKQPESEPALRQRLRDVFERVPVVRQFVSPAGAYGFHNPVLTLFSLRSEDFELLNAELMRKRQGELKETFNDVRASAKW
jgi:4-amino-4-deoxy-L-arabinose transferase-like glycosyltransferase